VAERSRMTQKVARLLDRRTAIGIEGGDLYGLAREILDTLEIPAVEARARAEVIEAFSYHLGGANLTAMERVRQRFGIEAPIHSETGDDA
jgi:hypothetical protein